MIMECHIFSRGNDQYWSFIMYSGGNANIMEFHNVF